MKETVLYSVAHCTVNRICSLFTTKSVDHSEITEREKKQQLDMINVSLSLLKLQRDEALTRNDREAAMMVMRSMEAGSWKLEAGR